MQFGLQFFPDVRPDQKSGSDYFRDALRLAEESEKLGFSHIRIVEHYFHYYGGYSPNPMLFLAAAAQRTRRARLVTGAVLPIFNHPLKLAGEIGMLDAISDGRLDVGFARAFLPHEFRRFSRQWHLLLKGREPWRRSPGRSPRAGRPARFPPPAFPNRRWP